MITEDAKKDLENKVKKSKRDLGLKAIDPNLSNEDKLLALDYMFQQLAKDYEILEVRLEEREKFWDSRRKEIIEVHNRTVDIKDDVIKRLTKDLEGMNKKYDQIMMDATSDTRIMMAAETRKSVEEAAERLGVRYDPEKKQDDLKRVNIERNTSVYPNF